MIRFDKLFVLVTFLALSSTIFAIETTDVENYIEKFDKVVKLSAKKMDAGYKILDKAINKSAAEEGETTWLKPTLQLTILLLKHDPSNFSIEIFQDVYAKRRADVDQLLEDFPAKDRRLFKKYMKYYEETDQLK